MTAKLVVLPAPGVLCLQGLELKHEVSHMAGTVHFVAFIAPAAIVQELAKIT